VLLEFKISDMVVHEREPLQIKRVFYVFQAFDKQVRLVVVILSEQLSEIFVSQVVESSGLQRLIGIGNRPKSVRT